MRYTKSATKDQIKICHISPTSQKCWDINNTYSVVFFFFLLFFFCVFFFFFFFFTYSGYWTRLSENKKVPKTLEILGYHGV